MAVVYGQAKRLADAGTLNGSILTDQGWVTGSRRADAIPDEYVGFYPGITIDRAGYIPDITGKGNHLLYTKSMTDAIADGNTGYFTTGVGAQGSPQGFEIPIAAFNPDVQAGDSFFISYAIKFASQPSSLAAVGGNAGNVQVPGFALFTTGSGQLSIYVVGTDLGSTLAGTTSAVGTTEHRLSIYADGLAKRMFAWLDGNLFVNSYNLAIHGLTNTIDAPWWFGGGGIVGRDRATQASQFRDVTTLWAKKGYIKSPVYLDWLLRQNPGRMLSTEDLSK